MSDVRYDGREGEAFARNPLANGWISLQMILLPSRLLVDPSQRLSGA